MAPVNIVLLNGIIHIMAELEVSRCRSASLINISWNVCASGGADIRETVSSNSFHGALLFNDFHTGIVFVGAADSQEPDSTPVEIVQTTSGRCRSAFEAEDCRGCGVSDIKDLYNKTSI